MSGRGRSPELLVVVLAIGLVVHWFGSGPLLVLMWVALGAYALTVLVPIFGGLGKAVSWLAQRIEAAAAPPGAHEIERRRYRSEPYWQAYEAMGLQQMDKLRYLVEELGVDPFAPWPEHIQPRPMLAETLYDYAVGTNYIAARKFFEKL